MEDSFIYYLKKYVSECSRDFFYRLEDVDNDEAFKIQLGQENQSSELCGKLEHECGQLNGKRVLDIGCGAGGRSVAIALKGARVTGVDPLADGVRASRARAAKYTDIKTDFLVGEGEKMPFKDGSFDLVTSFCVLEHAQTVDRVIFEAYRALKKGGTFYCELPNHLFPFEGHYKILWFPMMPKILARAYFRLMGRNPRGMDRLNYITRKNIVKNFERQGFSDIRDINIDRIRQRIDEPDLIQAPVQRVIMRFFKRAGLSRAFMFLIIRFGLYPAIHLCARKADIHEE